MSTTNTDTIRAYAAAVEGRWIDTGLPNTDRRGRPTTPECVDLSRGAAMQFGAPEKAYGNGVDFAGNLARERGFTAVPAGAPLKPADTVSVMYGDRWPAPHGHVFTVLDTGDGDQVQVLEQNPTPARIRWTTVPRSAIVAVARPIEATPPTVTIKSGDTYWSIARRLAPSDVSATVLQLMALNPKLHPMNLPIGGTMRVPA